MNVWRLVRDTLLRWLRESVMIILMVIVLAAITLLILGILAAFGVDVDENRREGPIPTPCFPDQVPCTHDIRLPDIVDTA